VSANKPWTVVLHYPLADLDDWWPFYVALVSVPAGEQYDEALAAVKKARAEVARAWRKDQREHGYTEGLVNSCDFNLVFCSRGHVDVTYFGFQVGFEP
jgi:hypothetical protein